MEAGGSLDPLREGSADALDAWLERAGAEPGGTVTIVLASDDPDELTLRQARWLGSADRVFHAADVPAAILSRARADARLLMLDGEPGEAPGLTVIVTRG